VKRENVDEAVRRHERFRCHPYRRTGGDAATELLNESHEFCTSILDVMEIRSVLTKKKRVEQERVEEIVADIYRSIDIYAPEISDQISAYSLQQDTLLYTLDCVLLALAEDIGATLVTFDGELLENGGASPTELLE
jgi:predicted nucleic acid-binding protein